MAGLGSIQIKAQWLATHVLPLEPEIRGWLGRARHESFDVDDIVQETYARLVAANDLTHVVQVRAYVFRTVRSVIADRCRRKSIVSFSALSDIEKLDSAIELLTPEDHAGSRNELRFLLDRLQELPVKTRRIFMMSRVQGMSVKSIASETGIPASTVEKHIAKSLKHLMDAIKFGGNPSVRASSADEREGRASVRARGLGRG